MSWKNCNFSSDEKDFIGWQIEAARRCKSITAKKACQAFAKWFSRPSQRLTVEMFEAMASTYPKNCLTAAA